MTAPVDETAQTVKKRNPLLFEAEKALTSKDGQRAMELANQVLDEDEANVEAWLIAMKSFQLILPIEAYQSQNELTCAEAAIHYAEKSQKYHVCKQVFLFLMTKILDVLKRDEEILKDARGLLDTYQREVYFDAKGANAKMIERDKPVRDAVLQSFVYCRELFDFMPNSFLKKNAKCRNRAAELASQWARTYGYLEMRYELYGRRLSEEYVRNGIQQYARFLRPVKNKEELLGQELSFNIYHIDQLPFLQ